jgi:copper chaperone
MTVEIDMSELVSLTVTGMKCGGCETNVKTKLDTLDGVISVEAKNKENKVDVEFDAALTNVEAISQAITDAGFVVE